MPAAYRPAPQDSTREVLLRTPRFIVERRTSPRPNAKPHVREYIVHNGSVVVLPVLRDGRIVMNRQVRPGVQAELLELPAGTLEDNEDPLAAAERELEEETGYVAGTMEPIGEFFTSPGFITERMRAYRARDLRQTQQKLDEGEQITVQIVDINTIRAMLTRGELRDAKTIAVLGMYLLNMDAPH